MPKLTAIRKQTLDEMMKASVFEATVAVLGEFGIAGMTMDRVAAKAGMAKGNLYRYFTNKKALLEFAYTKLVDPLLKELERLATSELPAIGKLSEEVNVLLKHVAKHGQVYKLLFKDEVVHSLVQPIERRSTETSLQRLSKVFSQGIAEGVFETIEPRMLANIFMYICRGVLEFQPKLKEAEQRESIRKLILGTLLNGVATEKGRLNVS